MSIGNLKTVFNKCWFNEDIKTICKIEICTNPMVASNPCAQAVILKYCFSQRERPGMFFFRPDIKDIIKDCLGKVVSKYLY
jgi:hypothetical protein